MAREFGKVVGYFVNMKEDNVRKYCETKKEVKDFFEAHQFKKIKFHLVVQYNGGTLAFQKVHHESIDSYPIHQELIRVDLEGRKSDWRIPSHHENRSRHHRSET